MGDSAIGPQKQKSHLLLSGFFIMNYILFVILIRIRFDQFELLQHISQLNIVPV
jgi:hypothetical protein